MDFFKQLFELSENFGFTMRIQRKNTKLTVSISPDNLQDIQPMILTGTPEELDANFFKEVEKPMLEAGTMAKNTAEFLERYKKESENKQNKPPAKSSKTTSSKPAAAAKDKKPKAQQAAEMNAFSNLQNEEEDGSDETEEDVSDIEE